MLTRTLPNPEVETITPKEQAEKSVNEKWFALYEWISPDELSLTIKRDYLKIVRWSSIPLAVITAIAWFIWFAWGVLGTILAVLVVLWVFYSIVFAVLFISLLRRAYSYTRMADIVMTDDHYIVWKHIFKKTEKDKIRKAFSYMERAFEEPFLEKSVLPDTVAHEKKNLFENLKDIALWGGKILQSVGRWKNSGWIVIAIVVAWILYGVMMALVYFLGILFISLFWRIFSLLAYQFLLATNNTEHRIQNLFKKIDGISRNLEWEKIKTIALLTEAWRNEWKENLLWKINESTELIAELAGKWTNDTKKLQEILESSRYKEIFNFIKFGGWIKTQILEPIESILSLLKKNHTLIEKTIQNLGKQISETTERSHKWPLEAQQTRLEIQKESFERVMKMLEEYKEKLSKNNISLCHKIIQLASMPSSAQ